MFTRYRNLTLLGVVILAQLLLLAYQVRRPDAGGVRLLRLWTIRAVVPVARATHSTVAGARGLLRNYVLLRGARQEAASLQAQLQQVELENLQLRAAAQSAARLDALLDFRLPVIEKTLPAQVIGGSASPDSQVLYLNRGSEAGLKRDMPVIAARGVIGKITQVFPGTAEVLMITDPDSGVGAMIAETHVHGILWGMGPGSAQLRYVAAQEKVTPGMEVVTSGEDQIYPPGLALGTITAVEPHQPFQIITVRPQVDLARVDAVLVATRIAAEPAPAAIAGLSAAQLRDRALPSIPTEPFNPTTGPPPLIADLLAARRKARETGAAAPKPPAAALAGARAPAKSSGERGAPASALADPGAAAKSARAAGVTAARLTPAPDAHNAETPGAPPQSAKPVPPPQTSVPAQAGSPAAAHPLSSVHPKPPARQPAAAKPAPPKPAPPKAAAGAPSAQE